MIVRATLVRIALLSTALGALTGCDTVGGAMSSAGSSVGGFFSHRDPNAEGLNLGASPNPRQVVLQPTANPTDRLKVLPVAAQDINCPDVTVADGGAALRVGGPENSSVRYQFNIGDTARQCDPAGPGQAAIKIGVAGQVVIGPAGSAGTFNAPVKITVTQLSDNKTVVENRKRFLVAMLSERLPGIVTQNQNGWFQLAEDAFNNYSSVCLAFWFAAMYRPSRKFKVETAWWIGAGLALFEGVFVFLSGGYMSHGEALYWMRCAGGLFGAIPLTLITCRFARIR